MVFKRPIEEGAVCVYISVISSSERDSKCVCLRTISSSPEEEVFLFPTFFWTESRRQVIKERLKYGPLYFKEEEVAYIAP